MSDEEFEADEGPSEAELALARRREVKTTKGLTEDDKELLDTNKADRDRMAEEIQELKRRQEKRKKERDEEEKHQAEVRAEEEQRRKAVEEEKRRKKDEEEQKRKAKAAAKRAEFEKMAQQGEEEGKERKSKEQLDAEKKAILKQRIVPLEVDGLGESALQEKAKEYHKAIVRLEGEKYDLEKRFKGQQVDMMELANRARQANRVGGQEGLKRMTLADGESDSIGERFAGTPMKVLMFSKYERQLDKRGYNDKQNVFTGATYIHPPERIKPSRQLKWNEAGMPIYEDLPEGEAPPPAAEPAAEEE